mmetsp:Transcript_15311/g.22441  ORF Transcript_15311/g.22441 Transcript_15311/m.22441 type:complete len:342 (+) Transcript_15311:15-1040(+)
MNMNMNMNKQILLLFLSLQSLTSISVSASSPSQETYMGRRVSKTLQFLSPLQSLTLFPKDKPTATPRDDFIPKFKAGLEAEKEAREFLAAKRSSGGGEDDEPINVGKGWEKRSEENDRIRAEREERFVDEAYDRGVAGYTEASKAAVAKIASSSNSNSNNKFQFVGVVQPPNAEKKVKWYARKRPTNSKWNVRLLHANRDVIVRDMFVNGKVDVFAKYVNSGERRDVLKEGEDPSAPHRPLIKADYNIKKRTPWNLWNFSPKHFFTDSSGAFWRERRLSPGLYTDGNLVYESKYRYSDGKNGMKPISKLDALLRSKSIKDSVKIQVLDRLETDAPDVVIED